MKGIAAALALLAVLLSGCASMTVPLDMTAQARCEHDGAIWRAVFSFCEYQADGTQR